ncbi:divalent-cation tolerance protein CutA [bacterium]|nr:divalent-cation tolerance protein CutA [bacterium]
MAKQEHNCEEHDKSSDTETGYLQITATANDQKEAEALINFLTNKKLVACAQVQGPESSVENDSGLTWRCRFKTSNQLYPDVESELRTFFDNRKYSVKALPIVKGSEHFLSWLGGELSKA